MPAKAVTVEQLEAQVAALEQRRQSLIAEEAHKSETERLRRVEKLSKSAATSLVNQRKEVERLRQKVDDLGKLFEQSLNELQTGQEDYRRSYQHARTQLGAEGLSRSEVDAALTTVIPPASSKIEFIEVNGRHRVGMELIDDLQRELRGWRLRDRLKGTRKIFITLATSQ